MKSLFCLLSVLIVLSACNGKEAENDIFQYKDSYVGDNSVVGNILSHSLVNYNGFELKTDEEPYGIIVNNVKSESQEKYKETVIVSATYLFTLVHNVDWITFQSDFGEYTLQRANVEEAYGKKLSDVESEEELSELINALLKDKNKVNHVVS